ncbi:MAG: hypothetical protein H7Y86_10010 [Rhizobacter sp.]|nr:hypothetical protein [Ferruginibacter sp.]
MKKRNGLFYALAALLISCGHHNGDTDISYKDQDQYYQMNARFNENRTRAVEHYMNSTIGKKNNISFVNMESNAAFTLDDGTKFHLKKYPGHIEIELDKTTNTKQAYYAIKKMCEGMKDVILD